MAALQQLANLTAQHFDWEGWERLIEANGLTIDRPYRSPHPRFPEIIYPLDSRSAQGGTAPVPHSPCPLKLARCG